MVLNKDILCQILQSKKLHLSYPLGLPVCKILRAYHALSCVLLYRRFPSYIPKQDTAAAIMAIVSCLLCLLNFPNQDEWGKLPVLASWIVCNQREKLILFPASKLVPFPQ